MDNKFYLIWMLIYLISFFFTILILKIILPLLIKLKFGQKILTIGPSWHQKKEGTPTMGGIAFATSICLCTIIAYFMYGKSEYKNIFILIIFAFLNFLIGLTDDLSKIIKKKNEGLKPFQKYLLLFMVSSIFLISLTKLNIINTNIYVPFIEKEINFGIFYYIFALIFLTGFINATNLTDGLDGLCTSITLIISIFMFLYGIISYNIEIRVLSLFIMGALSAFLLYNYHPAKIFMGDTGSLFLGALVSGAAVIYNYMLPFLIIGFFYFFEAISVILQVLYYKLTKKRIFLMAPFHHHLEKKGFSEEKIVLIASIITIISSFIGFFIL